MDDKNDDIMSIHSSESEGGFQEAIVEVLSSNESESVALPSEVGSEEYEELFHSTEATPDGECSGKPFRVTHLMEIFSQPRLIPTVQRLGLRLIGDKSIDILTGYDLLCASVRAEVMHMVMRERPRSVVLSPPCTMFSQMMRSNWSRMKPQDVRQRWKNAKVLFGFALHIANLQIDMDALFVLEHPRQASSWKLPGSLELMKRKGVKMACFHQCQYGLKTPLSKTPMKKAIALLTNSEAVFQEFDGKVCTCQIPHKIIEGQEGGVKLTSHAEIYPDELCEALVRALWQDVL